MPNKILESIPQYIKYDFFITIIGLLILYLLSSKQVILNQAWENPILLIGILFTAYGLIEMNNNYDKNQKLEQLRHTYEKLKLQEEIILLKEKHKK